MAQATNQTISIDLKSTPDGQLFYVEAKIGRFRQQQKFNLLVSNTYFLTWIPSIKMSPTKGYLEMTPEEPFLASTGTEFGTSVFRPQWDRMQIGDSLVMEDQQFAVLSDNINHFLFGKQSPFDGILGLSGYETEPQDARYLLKNLLHSSRIDKFMFSLYINNSMMITKYDDDDNQQQAKATLVLGGVDRKYYKGDINYAKLYENCSPTGTSFLKLSKTLIISSIQMNWTRVEYKTRTTLQLTQLHRTGIIDMYSPPATLRLDTTTKLFVGDQVILDRIHLDFIGARLVGENGVYVFYDCSLDNKPDIVFSMNEGIDITITPNDYVLRGQIDGTDVCLSAFKPLDLRSNRLTCPLWVFGTRFLRKYYTVFDYENDVVGFAEPK